MDFGLHEYESAMSSIRDGVAAQELLQKERGKTYKRSGFTARWDALWHAEYLVKSDLQDRRRLLALICAPWFDASAFENCCPKCGGDTHTAKYGPECSAGCDTSVEACSDCGWQGQPE